MRPTHETAWHGQRPWSACDAQTTAAANEHECSCGSASTAASAGMSSSSSGCWTAQACRRAVDAWRCTCARTHARGCTHTHAWADEVACHETVVFLGKMLGADIHAILDACELIPPVEDVCFRQDSRSIPIRANPPSTPGPCSAPHPHPHPLRFPAAGCGGRHRLSSTSWWRILPCSAAVHS